jgi:hypothetical protein
MAQQPPPYGSRSSDGRWWWDGQVWQPVPPPPPAYSQAPLYGQAPMYGQPFTYGPPGYGQPGGAWLRGPVGPPGRQRSIGVSILLSIVTLGIYNYFWTFMTQDEIKRYSGLGVGGGIGLLIYFFVSPATWFLVPSELAQMYAMSGARSPVRGLTGFWILLPLAGPFVWFIKVQGALNAFWATHQYPGM